MLEQLPGVYYTEHTLPAVAADANTAYEAVIVNPFEEAMLIVSIAHVPIEDITGDDTDSQNFNIDLVDATEIANLDYPTDVDTDRGVPAAFTLTGTTAQLTLAVAGAILVEREEVGTQPALLYGSKIRVGWKKNCP